MAKKKVAATKTVEVADQIKALIDAGDFVGAQALISGQVKGNAPSPKKRGRPPKKKAEKVKEPPTPSTISPANNPTPKNSRNDISGCIAPSRKSSYNTKPVEVEINGKKQIRSVKVPWTPPEGKNKFKDTGKEVPHEKLDYPEPSERRDPVEQIKYICYRCDHVDWLYPGQGPDEDMFYTCERCMKKSRGR